MYRRRSASRGGGEGEQLGKVFALSDRSISRWWRGTVALAQPMASHYESQAASTRNRGFRPLCEPAGVVWWWWWRRRLWWRRRRSDHDNYDRHNYDKYDRHDNYDNVGRSAGAVKNPAQGNRSACPGLDRRGELAEACSHAVLVDRSDARGTNSDLVRLGSALATCAYLNVKPVLTRAAFQDDAGLSGRLRLRI
jgi:hypothetical protein